VGDRFAAVGSNAEVLKMAGPATQKIDLGGKCIVPGIIETHVHPIGAALSEIDGPVPVVHSIAELKDYIQTQDKKLPPGRLIFIPRLLHASDGTIAIPLATNSTRRRPIEKWSPITDTRVWSTPSFSKNWGSRATLRNPRTAASKRMRRANPRD